MHNIKDLGIIYKSEFEFNLHLNAVVSKAVKLLGFGKRATKEFKNIDTLVCLYKSLIHSNLLYCL